jgi:hypothetical protein
MFCRLRLRPNWVAATARSTAAPISKGTQSDRRVRTGRIGLKRREARNPRHTAVPQTINRRRV